MPWEPRLAAGKHSLLHAAEKQRISHQHLRSSRKPEVAWRGLVMVCSGHTAACATNTRPKGAANDQTDQTPLSRLIYYGRSSSIICGRPSSGPRLFAVRNVTTSAGWLGGSGLVTPSVCTFLSQLAIICNPRLFIWYPHCIVMVHRHHAARDHTFTTRHERGGNTPSEQLQRFKCSHFTSQTSKRRYLGEKTN